MVPGCHQTLQKALDGLEWTPVFSTTPEHGSVDGLNTCETVMAMMSVGYLSHKPQSPECVSCGAPCGAPCRTWLPGSHSAEFIH